MRIRAGYLEIVACALTWGTIGPIARHIGVSPVAIAFFRESFGFVTVLLFLAVTGRARELRLHGRARLLVLSGVLLTVHWALQFVAFARAGVATGILVIFLGPVLAAAAAPLVLGERFRPHLVAGALVGFGGLALITIPRVGHADALGVVAAFGSGLAFAALLLSDKVLVRDYTAPAIVVWQLGVAALALSPTLANQSLHDVVRALPPLALLGMVHTGVLGLVFFAAVRALDVQRLGVVYYLEPASAVLFAWWWLPWRPVAPR